MGLFTVNEWSLGSCIRRASLLLFNHFKVVVLPQRLFSDSVCFHEAVVGYHGIVVIVTVQQAKQVCKRTPGVVKCIWKT